MNNKPLSLNFHLGAFSIARHMTSDVKRVSNMIQISIIIHLLTAKCCLYKIPLLLRLCLIHSLHLLNYIVNRQTYESIIRAPSIIIKYSLYTDIVVQIVDDATSVVVSAADDSCHRLSVVS